jgi:hypothetical protein
MRKTPPAEPPRERLFLLVNTWSDIINDVLDVTSVGLKSVPHSRSSLLKIGHT